jgi:hypothetical protein
MLVRTSKDKDHPYVMLNKTFLEDQNLSLKAKGLLAYCMCKPDGWQFHITQMAEVLKEGRDAIYSAFKELIKFGYCVRKQERVKGQYDNGEYVLYEIPEKPETEKPDTVSPELEKAALVINDNSNKEIKKKRETDSYGKYVEFTKDEYQELCLKHGVDKVHEIIQSINDHCVNNRPKGYRDYTGAFRTFLKNYKSSQAILPKQTNQEKVQAKFKNGSIYNGAECYLDNDAIGFQRGITHLSVRFIEKGFDEQLANMLRKFGI